VSLLLLASCTFALGFLVRLGGAGGSRGGVADTRSGVEASHRGSGLRSVAAGAALRRELANERPGSIKRMSEMNILPLSKSSVVRTLIRSGRSQITKGVAVRVAALPG